MPKRKKRGNFDPKGGRAQNKVTVQQSQTNQKKFGNAFLGNQIVHKSLIAHAGAVAVVGWYLMVPPVSGYHELNSNAALAKWDNWGSFDSAAECADAQLTFKRNYDQRNDALGAYQIATAQCIATDDPRLKER